MPLIISIASPSLRGRGLKHLAKSPVKLRFSSPSLRGRGLKPTGCSRPCASASVALFARAWIETLQESILEDKVFVALFARAWIETTTVYFGNHIGTKSPSLRGRGLKLYIVKPNLYSQVVALFARAWIETSYSVIGNLYCNVALFARAWIETAY